MEKEVYEPQELDFVLPEAVRELFPLELEFKGCETEKDIIKKVNEHFNVMFPENEVTYRYMDERRRTTSARPIASLSRKTFHRRKRPLRKRSIRPSR